METRSVANPCKKFVMKKEKDRMCAREGGRVESVYCF